jgi:hypothetical protein
MDEFYPGMWIVGGIIFFIAMMFTIAANANHRQELRGFAKRWNARLHDGGLFGGMHVDLDFGGATARLDYTSNEDESLTHLTVPLRLPLGRLTLRPQHLGHNVGKFLGMQDIEIGVDDFDRSFIIQGSDPKSITDLLTPPVRDAIFAVGRLTRHGRNDIHLSIGSGTLRITVGTHLSSESSLSDFITRCRVLFDLLNPDTSHGIEFISAKVTGAPAKIEAECQICGSALKENIVYCAKCKTPHHRDCWQYFGSCSVYGCGQKRFVTFDNR